MSLKDNIKFYAENYDQIFGGIFDKKVKVFLGERDKSKRVCRFCRRKSPQVSFKSKAHALPEALGNKSIETGYECDECNAKFGQGIEDHFGKWSLPMRTFARIRGKRGFSTIKGGMPASGWRVEAHDKGINISSNEDNPFYLVDEKNNHIEFKMTRSSYLPIGVLKTFMKIALSLIPESEIGGFDELTRWVSDNDPQLAPKNIPVIYWLLPYPVNTENIFVTIIRRKPVRNEIPYAFMILQYGNEVFQIPLPCLSKELELMGKTIKFPVFPVPESPDPEKYESPGYKILDLTGDQLIKDEEVKLRMGYERIEQIK